MKLISSHLYLSHYNLIGLKDNPFRKTTHFSNERINHNDKLVFVIRYKNKQIRNTFTFFANIHQPLWAKEQYFNRF